METSRLEIGCAAIKYLVPAGHPSPPRIRDRLDTVIKRELPQTLARAFDSWFSDSDSSIWIIRRLHVNAAVNAGGEAEQISRALAAQIAKTLGATFQEENQDNVRHFPSRAAYLASFLVRLGIRNGKEPVVLPIVRRTECAAVIGRFADGAMRRQPDRQEALLPFIAANYRRWRRA